MMIARSQLRTVGHWGLQYFLKSLRMDSGTRSINREGFHLAPILSHKAVTITLPAECGLEFLLYRRI